MNRDATKLCLFGFLVVIVLSTSGCLNPPWMRTAEGVEEECRSWYKLKADASNRNGPYYHLTDEPVRISAYLGIWPGQRPPSQFTLVISQLDCTGKRILESGWVSDALAFESISIQDGEWIPLKPSLPGESREHLPRVYLSENTIFAYLPAHLILNNRVGLTVKLKYENKCVQVHLPGFYIEGYLGWLNKEGLL